MEGKGARQTIEFWDQHRLSRCGLDGLRRQRRQRRQHKNIRYSSCCWLDVRPRLRGWDKGVATFPTYRLFACSQRSAACEHREWGVTRVDQYSLVVVVVVVIKYHIFCTPPRAQRSPSLRQLLHNPLGGQIRRLYHTNLFQSLQLSSQQVSQNHLCLSI